MNHSSGIVRASSRSRTFLLACACIIVDASVVTWPVSLAHAAGPVANESAALKHFEDGKAHYDAGEFELALVSFQASLALLPSPNSRLYIGRCYRAIGKAASAYTSLRLAAREAQDRLNTTGEKRYGATGEVAATEAKEIEPKVPRLTLRVPAGLPADFRLTLDGAEVPKEAWGTSVETDSGPHVVEARGERVSPFKQSFELAVGEQKMLEVTLARIPTAMLSLGFASRPSGLSLRVDGVAIDPSAVDRVREVDVGNHAVIAQAPGYEDFLWNGELTDRELKKVDVRLVAATFREGTSAGPPKWITFSVGAVGVASLGVASVFAFQAKSASVSEQAKDPLERDAAEQGSIRTTSTRANILFVTGGAFVAGAGVLAILTNWHAQETPKKSAAAVSPWVGPGALGFGASGAF